MKTLTQLLTFLFEHADLFEEVYEALKAGTPKDAIKAGIRRAKADISREAIKEEMGG